MSAYYHAFSDDWVVTCNMVRESSSLVNVGHEDWKERVQHENN